MKIKGSLLALLSFALLLTIIQGFTMEGIWKLNMDNNNTIKRNTITEAELTEKQINFEFTKRIDAGKIVRIMRIFACKEL